MRAAETLWPPIKVTLLNIFNMQSRSHLVQSRRHWPRNFDLSVNIAIWSIWFGIWSMAWNGLVFNKFKPLNMWVKTKFFFLSFYFSESCHLPEYTLKRFGGLFSHCTATCTRPEIFPSFKQVWGICVRPRHFATFQLVFLFDFLKWNSTIYQIYWIPDLQSLKLVCFIDALAGSEKIQISGFHWQDGGGYQRRRVKTFLVIVEVFSIIDITSWRTAEEFENNVRCYFLLRFEFHLLIT